MLPILQFPGGPQRTTEDLKERYYGIARKLLIAREGTDATIANHSLVRNPYNAAHERNRKQALIALLHRTPQQEEQENLVRLRTCSVGMGWWAHLLVKGVLSNLCVSSWSCIFVL